MPIADHRADTGGEQSVRPLFGYPALLLSVIAIALMLSTVLGDGGGVTRIAWLGAGLALGGLWVIRARLPVLRAERTRIAVGGWLGLVLAGVATVALAPTIPPPATFVAGLATAGSSPQRVLRPAPPTAVRRTGTLGPSVESRATATASPPASAQADSTPDTGAGLPMSSPEPIVAESPVPRRSPTAVRAAASPGPVLPADFDAGRYLNQGNVYNCDHFASQAEAQAVLRADPSDPNVIDQNRDGIACESNPPPRDTRRVPRSAP